MVQRVNKAFVKPRGGSIEEKILSSDAATRKKFREARLEAQKDYDSMEMWALDGFCSNGGWSVDNEPRKIDE